MADDEPDSVLILFMGRVQVHAITSIQHYTPDAVHIVTSDDYRASYVRRLNDWSKKYNFRKGTVQSVSDLFEPTCVSSLLGCVFQIAGHENKLSEGKMMTAGWSIGITGGTMHMAAVATMASGILDAKAFYVMRPNEGEAIMPNKHIIELPGLAALKMAMALKPQDIMAMMETKTSTIELLIENTDIQPWMIPQMEIRGLIDIHPEKPLWHLSETGAQLFLMLSSGPMFSTIFEDEMRKIKAIAESASETDYHG